MIFIGRANDAFDQLHIRLPVLKTALLFTGTCRTPHIIFRGLVALWHDQGTVSAFVDSVINLIGPGRTDLIQDSFGARRAVIARPG
jgi:hypothetical protein